MKDRKQTIAEQLRYWRSVELGAQMSVESYDRRAAELDSSIELLRKKRDQLDIDRDNAPVLAVRARGEIRKLERLEMQAKLAGSDSRRVTGATVERKRKRLEKRVDRLRRLKRKIADLQKQLGDAEAEKGGAA